MNTNEIKAIGQLTVTKLDGVTGKTETQVIPNLIVTIGKQYIAGRMLQTPQTAMSCMAIGTGSTNAAITDTRLEAEVAATIYVGSQRPLFEAAYNPAKVGATLTYTTVFMPVATVSSVAITEAGIFDNRAVSNNIVDSGLMMARTTFGTVTKTHLDTLTITWSVQVL